MVSTDKCLDTLQLSLDVQAAPLEAVENRLDLLCLEDEDGAVSLFITGGTEPFTVDWSTGEIGPSISGLLPGEYSYELVDANGCELTDTVLVDGPEPFILESEIKFESCFGNRDGEIEVSVLGGTAPYELLWSNGQNGLVMENASAGAYELLVRDANNCEHLFSFLVEADCDELLFYDVLTPNGDGQNETWWIEGVSFFPENTLEIYDRWGEMVYRTQAYANDWSGTRNDGSALPEGVYFYILEMDDATNRRYTGSITLIR